MTSRPLQFACTLAFLCSPLCTPARGQTPSTPAASSNVRITAVGGFLGYQDGLSSRGRYRGGLVAFESWFAGQIKSGHFQPDDLLLVAGNNVPLRAGSGALLRGPAWTSLLSAKPAAIALSVDDFRRALAPVDGVKNLIEELSSATGMPLVATNAIIRARRDKLNVIESEGFQLEVPEHESIDWKTSVRVQGGVCANVTWNLVDRGGPEAPVPDVSCKPADADHFTLELKPALRPGRRYELEITPLDRTRKKAVFRFQTHRALVTLPAVDGAPSALQGLPVRVAVRDFDGAPKTPVIIIAMVNPDVKKGLGADRWKWKASKADCPGAECEIDFLPATDAFKTIVSFATGAAKAPHPVFVMMSGLTDRQTLAVMSMLQEDVRAAVPVVLLDPDTWVLGRDVGFESIVNGGKSLQQTPSDDLNTQVWVRPPWTGTRADVISAHLAWSEKTESWRVTAPQAFAEPIIADRPEVAATADSIAYKIPGADLGSYPAYATYRGDALAPEEVWTGLATLFLDVMRRHAGAELAMLPKHVIDEDIVKWLAEETGKKAGEKAAAELPFSSFILQKSIYQTENIVTAAIEGSKLAATLAAIVRAQNTDGESVFVAGIGATGAQSQIDTRHLLVNGRGIVPDRFYKVALPESLAEGQSLQVADGSAIPSLLDAVDAHLRTRGGPVLRSAQEIRTPEQAYAGRKQLYYSLNPAKFSYFRATPNEATALKTIPLAGRTVKEERQWAISGKGDFGLDAPRWAVRETGDLKFAKNTLSTPPTYPEDEWTTGGRFDWKFDAGNVRIFGGGFIQSQFRYRQDAPVTPSRTLASVVVAETGEIIAGATAKGAAVTPLTQDPGNPDRPAYRFGRGGIEVLSWAITPWLSVKNAAAAYDFGRTYNERTHVMLGSLGEFDIAEVYKAGMDVFLNGLFVSHPEAFAAPQNLEFRHASHSQNRLQFDGTLELKAASSWKRWLRAMTITNTAQIRLYGNEDERPTFTANWSADLKTSVEWTVVNRLKLGPYVNYYRVGVSLPEGSTLGKLDYLKTGIELNVPLFISFRPAVTFQ